MKILYAMMLGMVFLLVLGCTGNKTAITGLTVMDVEEEPEVEVEPAPVQEQAPKQVEVENEECAAISDENVRDACYIKVGIDEDDVRYCTKVSNKEECIVMIEAQDEFEMGW